MTNLFFYLTTAALMVLMFRNGVGLLGSETFRGRRVPWGAVAVTGVTIAGIVLQLSWSGAMNALDLDPSRSGWWRVFTSVFMQNGGALGGLWNLVSLAVIAALAEWAWGTSLMLGIFAVGILVPSHVDALFGIASAAADPRNFAGSSGATYFLAATLSAMMLLRARGWRRRLLALAVPAVGLAMWFVQANGHGLVTVYGFVLGVGLWLALQRVLDPDRDLHNPPRRSVGQLIHPATGA